MKEEVKRSNNENQIKVVFNVATLRRGTVCPSPYLGLQTWGGNH